MEAREYLKLATEKTEAGELIEENNLTEAIVKMLENYALIRVKKLLYTRCCKGEANVRQM